MVAAPFEIALVALDLGGLHRLFGEWEALEELAAKTYDRFRKLSGDTEAVVALSLWMDAVRAQSGTAAAMAGARKIVEARVTPAS